MIHLAAAAFALALENQQPETKDYDAPAFLAWKTLYLDRSAEPWRRANAIREMVMADAPAAMALLPAALEDPVDKVRDTAAEWLAVIGDLRGLARQAECARDDSCVGRFDAIRRIGTSRRSGLAPVLVELVRERVARRAPDGRWTGIHDSQVVHEAIVALAHLDRREDHDLIFSVLATDPSFRRWAAVGYVDDPRSHEVLQRALSRLSAGEIEAGNEAEILIALSRLHDPGAVARCKDILRGVGTPPDRWLPNMFPELSAVRASAFSQLRPRDAPAFAETVFSVAAQEPEGPGTLQAWAAIGVMHPEGFGRRVLELALRRRPHWKTVSREFLNTVLLAVDPDPTLNVAFWSGIAGIRAPIPAKSGTIKLVRAGLGALLFNSSWYWIGE